MKISVIIPAHNEEKFIEGCLNSIRAAELKLGESVEIVVCLNRCNDRTEEIARFHKAVIAYDDSKNLAKIRNSGVRASSGEIVVTIDADSRMSNSMLSEIKELLASGKYIGGGTRIKPERYSIGIVASTIVILYYAIKFGLKPAGLFWCRRSDFDAIDGFNESLVSLEDLDFAKRLAVHGKTKDLKYGTTWRSHIVTSCRKFDKFGDWYFFKNPKIVKSLFSGVDSTAANKFYYEIER